MKYSIFITFLTTTGLLTKAYDFTESDHCSLETFLDFTGTYEIGALIPLYALVEPIRETIELLPA